MATVISDRLAEIPETMVSIDELAEPEVDAVGMLAATIELDVEAEPKIRGVDNGKLKVMLLPEPELIVYEDMLDSFADAVGKVEGMTCEVMLTKYADEDP